MQRVTARVETEEKPALPYWTKRHGPPTRVEGDAYKGSTAYVGAEDVRVRVSPEYDGVWTWIQAEGVTIRVQVRPDGSVEIEDVYADQAHRMEVRIPSRRG